MERNSRHTPKSLAEGSQPVAMASSLPGCRPTNPASAARSGFLVAWPESSSTANSPSVTPAARAAGLTEGELAVLEDSGQATRKPDLAALAGLVGLHPGKLEADRKSTRLNSSHR